MQQKTTWMRYLRLGLAISLIAILNSCKDDFFTIIVENHFVNETNYAITYPTGYEKFNVPAKSSIIVTERAKSGGKGGVRESDFPSPLSILSPVVQLTIKFGQSKCLVDVRVDDLHSVRDIKNFKAETLGDNHFKYTYTFTEADYTRATSCL